MNIGRIQVVLKLSPMRIVFDGASRMANGGTLHLPYGLSWKEKEKLADNLLLLTPTIDKELSPRMNGIPFLGERREC